MMRRARLMILAGTMGLAMTACATPQDSYQWDGAMRLSDNSLRDFMQGTTFEVTTDAGQPVVAFFGVGGDAYIKSGETKDKGAWRLSDDGSMLCTKWETIRDGREACFTVLRKGDDVRLYDAGGDVSATGSFQRGDLERLAG